MALPLLRRGRVRAGSGGAKLPGARARADGGGGGDPLSAVFVSYRRAGGGDAASSCFRYFADRFGREHVVLDHEGMTPGEPYPDWLRAELERACALVALVDRNWLDRISDPDDWVRREVARSLERGIPVVPVLLDGVPPPVLDELPQDVRGLLLRQYTSLHQHGVEGDLRTIADAVVRWAPELLISSLFPAPAATTDVPTALLRPERHAVEFVGREPELDTLDAWVQGTEQLSLGLLTGPAGAGKTRLALELCRRLRTADRPAGLLRPGLDPERLVRLAELDIDLLLVVDRAESRSELVQAIVTTLSARAAQQRARIRLLLVARSAGPWLEQLSEAADERVQMLVDRRLTVPVGPLLGPGDGRSVEFRRAAGHFAAQLRTTAPDVLPDLSGPAYEDVLSLHAAALASVLCARSPAAGDVAEADPMTRILRYEREYWLDTAPPAASAAARVGRCRQVVAAVTLAGPDVPRDARDVLGRLPTFDGADGGTLDAWVEWAGQLYPGASGRAGLSPEPMADRFLADVLSERPEIATRCAGVATERQLRRMFASIGRAATGRGELAGVLAALLDPPSDRTVAAAVAAAGELADPAALVTALSAIITAPSASLDLARSVIDRLPDGNRALAPLAVRTIATALDAETARTDPDLSLAGYLKTNLAARLLMQSDVDGAAAAADDAVALYRGLSVLKPAAYAVPLAAALANQAIARLRRGDVADAVAPATEAMASFRAADPPGAGTRGLVKTAFLLAELHAVAGRPAEQLAVLEEAVAVARPLADTADPESAPEDDVALLAAALENLALARAADGTGDAVGPMRDAVARRASLAYRRPNPHRFAWVDALANLACLQRPTDPETARRTIAVAVAEARILARSGHDADRALLTRTLDCSSLVNSPTHGSS